MILSLRRMKESKLSPRQAGSDRPQTDQRRHPHEFLNLLICHCSRLGTALTSEVTVLTKGLITDALRKNQRSRGLPWRVFSPTTQTTHLPEFRCKSTADALCICKGSIAQLKGTLTKAIQVH